LSWSNAYFILFILKYFLLLERTNFYVIFVFLMFLNISLLKPAGYGMQQQVEDFNNCTPCPRCIYVFFICLRTNSIFCHLHQKIFVFITEMKSDYSAVWIGPLNEAVCAPSFKGYDVISGQNMLLC
jgi:hypothetical protein